MLLVQATPRANNPFFTNDWDGIIKLGALIVAIVGPLGTFFWKVMQGPFREADKTLDDKLVALTKQLVTDIDGVGERANEIESGCIANTRDIVAVTAMANAATHENSVQDKDIARLGEKYTNVEKELSRIIELLHNIDKRLVEQETTLRLALKQKENS